MTIPKPEWVDKAIRVNRSPGARTPLAIVMHVMEGTLDGCDSWFASPAARASANFGIGKNGAIHCYVDPASGDWAWANGLIDHQDAAVDALLREINGADANIATVAIEHEGMSGQPLTAPQMAASAWLTAWLLEQYGIPLDEDHLLGHYEFDSVTRAGCPGWDRNGWIAYEAAVKAVQSKYTPQPVPQPVVDVTAALKALDDAEGWIAQAKSLLQPAT